MKIQSEETGSHNGRRVFLKSAGKKLLAGTVAAGLVENADAMPSGKIFRADVKPVKFTPIEDESERTMGEVPTPLNPDKRIRFAIVGLGRLSLYQILPAIVQCKYARLTALVSGDKEKAANVAAQYGISDRNIYDYKNFDEIRNNKDVDVVYIVLPNSLHEEFTIRAARAGKHVLCEKPMSTSSAAAARMIEVCKSNSVKLMIAYRIQYEQNSRQVKEWLRDRTFGVVKIINAINAQNIGDPTQWRLNKSLAGGGSLPDIGLYNLNTIRYLTGEEPHTVMAKIYSTPGDPRFKEVEESVMFQMFFPSGLISSNVCSYGVHESRNYDCYADKGASFGVLNAFAYNGLQLKLSRVEGKMEDKAAPVPLAVQNQFTAEIDHMADCIIRNKIPFTPGEEGLQDHRIMEAIYKSAETGMPVTVEKVTTVDTYRGSEPEY